MIALARTRRKRLSKRERLAQRRVDNRAAHARGLLSAGPDARAIYAKLTREEWLLLGQVAGEHADYGVGNANHG